MALIFCVVGKEGPGNAEEKQKAQFLDVTVASLINKGCPGDA
jgi:hypothetical protein